MVAFKFNADEHGDINRTFDLLPLGWYKVHCEKSDLKDTSTGGQMISATFSVDTLGFSNRKIFKNFNVRNSSRDAQDIALVELANFARSVGKPMFENTQQLHDVIVYARVIIKKGDEKPDGTFYSDRNEIIAFTSLKDGLPKGHSEMVKSGSANATTQQSGPPAGFGQPNPAKKVTGGFTKPKVTKEAPQSFDEQIDEKSQTRAPNVGWATGTPSQSNPENTVLTQDEHDAINDGGNAEADAVTEEVATKSRPWAK